eukprot:jgi/Astpho2/8622/fgenesh1_pg.00126_%23_34_t
MTLQAGIQALRQCQQQVQRLALFSSNEDAEDITSADLKYLLVPAVLADLLARTPEQEPQQRLHLVGQAVELYRQLLSVLNQYKLHQRQLVYNGTTLARFIVVLHQYGLLSQISAAAWDADCQDLRPLDATSLRQQKVERFKRDRDIKAKLQQIRQQQLRSRRLAELQEPGQAEGAAQPDDADVREAWLLQIEQSAHQALAQLSLLKQEVQLLQHAAALSPEQRAQQRAPCPDDLIAQLQGAALNLGRGQTDQRQQLREEVYRPHVALPTISVEQQGDMEIAAMLEREAREKQAAGKRKEVDPDDEETDEQMAKLRAEDDWKDDHPFGWGNSKLRPTAQ